MHWCIDESANECAGARPMSATLDSPITAVRPADSGDGRSFRCHRVFRFVTECTALRRGLWTYLTENQERN